MSTQTTVRGYRTGIPSSLSTDTDHTRSTISSVHSALGKSLVSSDFAYFDQEIPFIDHGHGTGNGENGNDVLLRNWSYVSIFGNGWAGSSDSESDIMYESESESVKVKLDSDTRRSPVECKGARPTQVQLRKRMASGTLEEIPGTKSLFHIGECRIENYCRRTCSSMQDLQIHRPQSTEDTHDVLRNLTRANLEVSEEETPSMPACPHDSKNEYAEQLLKIAPDEMCLCSRLNDKSMSGWCRIVPPRKAQSRPKVAVRPDPACRFMEHFRLRACEHYQFHHYADMSKYIEQYRLYHAIGTMPGMAGRQPKLGVDVPDPYHSKLKKYMYRLKLVREHCPPATIWDDNIYHPTEQMLKNEIKPTRQEAIQISRQYSLEFSTPRERCQEKIDNRQWLIAASHAQNKRTAMHDIKSLKYGGRNVENFLVENRPLKLVKKKLFDAASSTPTSRPYHADDSSNRNDPLPCTLINNELIPSLPAKTADPPPKISDMTVRVSESALTSPTVRNHSSQFVGREKRKSQENGAEPDQANEPTLPKLPLPVPPKRYTKSEEAVILHLGKSKLSRKRYSDDQAYLADSNSIPVEPVYVIGGMTGSKIIKHSKKEMQPMSHTASQDWPDRDTVAIVKHLASKNPNITEMIFQDIREMSAYQKCLSQLRRFGVQEKKANQNGTPVAGVSLCEVYSSSSSPGATEPTVLMKSRQRGSLGKIGIKGSRCETGSSV